MGLSCTAILRFVVLRHAVCVVALAVFVAGTMWSGTAAAHGLEQPASIQVVTKARNIDTHSEVSLPHSENAHSEFGGHCHPGLDCSLAAMMISNQLVQRPNRKSFTHSVRVRLQLPSINLSDDHPPPRGFALI